MSARRVYLFWSAVALLVAAAWLWAQRYDYIRCDAAGHYCLVANRYTGAVGIIPSKAKIADWRSTMPAARVDSLLHDLRP